MKKLVVGVTHPTSISLLRGQLKFMSEHGFQVFLMADGSKNLDSFCKEENCTYIPIHIKRNISLFNDIRTLFEVLIALKKIKPDIVNFGTPKMGLIGILASFFLKVQLRIYTCRGFRFETTKGVLRTLLIGMERLSGKCSTKVICISPSLCEQAIELNIFSQEKMCLINKGSSNGIDLNLFSADNIDLAKRKNVLLHNDLANSFVYGFIGRICKDKGIKELYEAFSKIYNLNESSRLVLIGKIEDKSDKIFLLNLLNHPGVIHLGVIPKMELPTYFSIFNVFVLPTHREGFGNVLIEAAAIGIPVITTSVTGAKDAVRNGYNGILVPLNDVVGLERAMLQLQNNNEMRKEYANNGFMWVQNFKQEIIWNGLLNIYNAL